MISWKSKLKVFYPSLIVVFILAIFMGYLFTLQQPWVLQSIEAHLSESLALVISIELAIILFSFNYKEKSGVLQQATFTMEQIFRLVFPNYYRRAVALDGKNVADAI